MFPDLDRSGLDNSRKKKRTSYDTAGQVNFHHHGNLNKKTSNKQINQGEIDLSTHRRDFRPEVVEDPTVTVKCRTEIKVLILYFNLCLSVMLDPMEIQF
jgi:hypothetical protein